MKLDPEFIAKNHELYTIADEPVSTKQLQVIAYAAVRGNVPVAGSPNKTPVVVQIAWSAVESDPEVYDESYLADLRNYLKAYEENGCYALIEPLVDKSLAGSEEQFIAAMKHTARRIKDCRSVIGFAIPDVLTSADDYLEELSQKHGHYVYFAHSTNTAFANKNDIIWY